MYFFVMVLQVDPTVSGDCNKKGVARWRCVVRHVHAKGVV